MHARTIRHSPLVIRSGRRLGRVAAVVLSVAVMCAGGLVEALCIEDDGIVVVESILRLCCTEDPQNSSDGSRGVASPSRDACRDIFLTVEGTTEPSDVAWAPTNFSFRPHGTQADDFAGLLRPQIRPEEVTSVGHAGSSLKCLQSVRLLT